MKKKTLTDLEIFKGFFGMEPAKQKVDCLEYRVQDLDGSLYAAREIIAKNRLNVEALTYGSMASIRAFIVKEVNHA